uniref:CDGSH iron-sulfur domain-containing protein 2A-like isoform X2 n=1 Tax=Myxine glutinosa TaxID=7769 RepID=UPI00358FABA8
MEYVSRLFRQQLPAYLKALPVPSSLVGFLTLSVAEWLRLLPFLGLMTLLGYLAFGPLFLRRSRVRDRPINLKIQKETAKVVNEIHVEDLREAKKCYCRCWRSKTFPVCDGSHNRHNEETGDNVGPLVIKRKEL